MNMTRSLRELFSTCKLLPASYTCSEPAFSLRRCSVLCGSARSQALQTASRGHRTWTQRYKQHSYNSIHHAQICWTSGRAFSQAASEGDERVEVEHVVLLHCATACRSSVHGSSSDVPLQMLNTYAVQTSIIVGMLGLSYFSVPLYRIFCAATGYGGTVSEGTTVEDKIRKRIENPDISTEEAAARREVTVDFVSEVQPGLNWTFKPCQKSVKIRPGQSTLVFYTATNLSDEDVIGVSTYNVAPPQVGWFFNKIQCFCFEEQRLRPGESVDMPVFFYIDPEFATDRRLRHVDNITLSYVFFKTGELPKNDDGTELTPAPDCDLCDSIYNALCLTSGEKA